MTHSLHFSTIEETPVFRGIDTALIREYFANKGLETPTLLLSRSEIGRNYDSLKAALPRVGIHYAVKSNNHPVILAEIYKRGGHFDICSLGEIDDVLKIGAKANELIHTHPVKSVAEFDGAIDRGVEVFVVDNEEEVKKFRRYTNKKLKVMIRFRIATNNTAVVNLQLKFGCLVDEVLPLAKQIEDAGHEFYGLSFHIGSQCLWSENYLKAIDASKALIGKLDTAGFNTRVLDIGGGFPVQYVEPIPSTEDFCAPIRKALDKKIRPGVKLISEPGRFISASPVTLVCSIIGKSFRDGKMWYFLDDGLYSTFSGILYDHCQYPVVTDRQGEGKLSVLSGPTCDSFDVMYDGLMIPEQQIGDLFVFPCTGAYCSVSGSNFNSLKRPEYRVVD
ncbi:MAG: type III PLP-dependent enzyme [candidate division Zixibacteria bacterium]|nr:type III PLP-dependent enzyme [candidate division Zixibacteria bacterium]